MKILTCMTAVALLGASVVTVHAGTLSASAASTPSLALSIPAVTAGFTGIVRGGPSDTPYESIRYRPRGHRMHQPSSGGSSPMNGYVQLHGGVFDPSGDVSNGALFGMRVGTNADDKVQLGMQLDWSHRSDHQTAVLGNGILPGGGIIERRIDLSSVSSDLVPVMAFVQAAPGGINNGPYVGLAGGYQALFVSAQDFSTGSDFDATYDGWGWQFYAGFAFPLSGQTRLTLEGFTNSARLDRTVGDPLSGVAYREIVDAGGAGLRGGVSWGF